MLFESDEYVNFNIHVLHFKCEGVAFSIGSAKLYLKSFVTYILRYALAGGARLSASVQDVQRLTYHLLNILICIFSNRLHTNFQTIWCAVEDCALHMIAISQ